MSQLPHRPYAGLLLERSAGYAEHFSVDVTRLAAGENRRIATDIAVSIRS
jgi:hypothetical protein